MLNRIQYQKGVGLVEVLVSMMILSVGILGIVSLQSRSTQFNRGAMFESQAVNLAGDIMDRMRANPIEKNRYRIDLNDPSPDYESCDGTSANCSPSDLADYDVATWRAALAENLPQGNGEIVRLNGVGDINIFVIIIQYEDGRVEASSANELGGSTSIPKTVVFRTAI